VTQTAVRSVAYCEPDKIRAIREASGCEAHYREAMAINEQAQAILVELRQTKPVTIAGAIAMLELGLACGGVDKGLTNTALAGLRDMQQGSAA
jgi:hypothetical protein